MAINPATLNALRADINAALAGVAMKHGLKSLSAGRASYSEENFHFKLEGVVLGGLTPEAERYDHNRRRFGLPPLNTPFAYGARSFVTVGMNTTGTKVIAKDAASDRRYLVPTDVVARLCKVAA